MPLARRVFCILCLSLLIPFMVLAADLTLERSLQKDFTKSRILLNRIDLALSTGRSYASDLAELKEAGESIRAAHQELLGRLHNRGEQIGSLGGRATSRHAVVQERYEHSVSLYLTSLDALDSSRVRREQIQQLQSILAKILPERKRRIHGTLPHRHLNLPTTPPVYSPEVIPAYQGGGIDFSGSDLIGSPEAPISLPIAGLAESLHWNPVEMYEWVKNNIRTEWYWGVMKGAEETLLQKSGNDADQAALLVALFRSAGFPARYVRGVLEFFPDIEAARAQTGLDDPNAITAFFQKAGIPHEPVIAGGRIDNFRIEHIWVEVEIPYDNYRGVVMDAHGKTWLALDTSIKAAGYSANSPGAVLKELDLAQIREQYLAGFKPESPLQYLADRIDEQLAANASGMVYDDLLLNRSVNQEHLQIIPAGLQFTDVVVTGEYASLPDELLHKVRFSASALDGTPFLTGPGRCTRWPAAASP